MLCLGKLKNGLSGFIALENDLSGFPMVFRYHTDFVVMAVSM